MSFLILTKAQAEAVRGVSVPGHALEPVECEDGTFVLPDRVLNDPHHSIKKTALASRPKVEAFVPKVTDVTVAR